MPAIIELKITISFEITVVRLISKPTPQDKVDPVLFAIVELISVKSELLDFKPAPLVWLANWLSTT